MEMVDYDRMDLTENSSSERSYIPFIGRITHRKRSRICIIILAVMAVAFFLGFVVVISEHARNDKQEGDAVNAKQTAETTQQANGTSTNNDQLSELKEELAKAEATVKELQDKIAAVSCPPVSCDGFSLKEIEIPNGHGPAIKRNVSMDGNWTIIQRRIDGCVFFNKTWVEYRAGFGSPCGNFWLGLEAIHHLTKNRDHELRIDMIENGTGNHYYAEYSSFRLEDESVEYTLRASGYSGNATDSLTDITVHEFGVANNQKFSTFDVDNDEAWSEHCALRHSSGWWYRGCSITNLNGQFGAPSRDGIFWHGNNRMEFIPLIFSEMRIRRNIDSTPPCPPASCDGVTLKEIEIPTGNGPAMKRNVSMDGNWTIIQRRIDGCVSFAKTWVEYRAGFGSPCGNFWLGLEAIHQLTKSGDQELRIDMIENGTGTHYWAEYSSFKVEDESFQFTLRARGYSGNASDSLTDPTVHGFGVANNQMFSTFDVDNDEAHTVHCASKHSSGWWYRGCSITNLNGQFGGLLHDGIIWHDNNRMEFIPLIFSEMKIRRYIDSTPPCPPASCDGVTLKEIEIPTGNGPAMKRNVSIDGNWTIIQRRIDGCVSFDKTWVEYRAGFGSPCGNFWLGLEAIRRLTKNGDQKLRIDMIEHGTGIHYWAEYSTFKVGPASDNYRLTVDGYSGNATNALDDPQNAWGTPNNQQFTTKDRDNDQHNDGNCAYRWKSGWWFNKCFIVNLNGRYGGKHTNGIMWTNLNDGRGMNMEFTEMKFRNKN